MTAQARDLPSEWNYGKVQRPVWWWTKQVNGQVVNESLVSYFKREKTELDAPDDGNVIIHEKLVDLVSPEQLIEFAFSFLY